MHSRGIRLNSGFCIINFRKRALHWFFRAQGQRQTYVGSPEHKNHRPAEMSVTVHQGGPKKSYFREKFHDRGPRESLSDVRFENIFVFFFVFFLSPEPAIVKTPFTDFRKFCYTAFLMNLHHFPYFDQTKKSAKFFFIIFSGIFIFHAFHYLSFSGILYYICAPSVSAHAHNAILGIQVWENVGSNS